MMNKNCGFLRKVRLCLYLIFGLEACGCSILNSGNNTALGFKRYYLTVDIPRGFDENDLLTALHETAILNINQTSIARENFIEPREHFNLSVKINGETDLQRLLARLQASGFTVRSVIQ